MSLSEPAEPIVFAHRGSPSGVPENSLPAFVAAAERGATGLETGVRVTIDGQVVLFHDAHAALYGILPRPVRTLPRSALPAWVPDLTALYDRCGTELPLSVDVKDDTAFSGVVAAARAAGALEQLWVCAEDRDTLARWRDAEPAVRLCFSSSEPPFAVDRAGAALDALVAAGAGALNLRARSWSAELVAAARSAGLRVFAWDANRRRVRRRALELGVDAVYVDRLEPMLAALARGRP